MTKFLLMNYRRFRFPPRTLPSPLFSASHPRLQQEVISCGAQGFVLKPDITGLRREISRTLKNCA